jgi:hypothetical protein
MASYPDEKKRHLFNQATLKGMRDDLDCSVCLETFKDPRLLPCAHSLCRACIDQVLAGGSGGGMHCPLCRASSPAPANGGQGYPKNTLLTRLAEAFESTDFMEVSTTSIAPAIPSSTLASSPNNNNNSAPASSSSSSPSEYQVAAEDLAWFASVLSSPPPPFSLPEEKRVWYGKALLKNLGRVEDCSAWTLRERKFVADLHDDPYEAFLVSMFLSFRCFCPGKDDVISLMLGQAEEKVDPPHIPQTAPQGRRWVFLDSRFYLYKVLNDDRNTDGVRGWRVTGGIMLERDEFLQVCIKLSADLVVRGWVSPPDYLDKDTKDYLNLRRMGFSVIPSNFLGGACYNGRDD